MQLHGFEGYTARKCDDGWHVFSPTGRQLTERLQGDRPYVTLGPRRSRRTMQLGRAVLLAHSPAPGAWAHALHHDGDPWNNDPSNLYWGTPQDNVADAVRHGTHSPPPVMPGTKHPNCKLTDAQVEAIRAEYVRSAPGRNGGKPKEGSQTWLAAKYGVSQKLISLILIGGHRQASSPNV